MMLPLRFAQMLASRLCHDLIAPVGAINSGLELLLEEKGAENEELLQVVRTSSQTVARRLVFYRAVFGYSSAVQFKGLLDVERFLKDYLTTTKVTLSWDLRKEPSSVDTQDEAIDYPNWGRVLANFVLLLCETAPRGGNLTVNFSSQEPKKLPTLTIEGSLVPLKVGVERALWGLIPDEDITPHEVQAYLTRLLLEEMDADLERLEVSLEKISVFLKNKSRSVYPLFAERKPILKSRGPSQDA
ncbi:MAG: histidine phosphotransferase family protein [Alphaproteobacteria bacterium]|jgi:histidine phosphotransferase ChpT